MSKSRLILGALLLVVLLAALPLASACSPKEQTPAEFYKGATMYVEVATDVGADADIIARTITSTVKDDIGAAAIIVENKTGAGGIEAWNGAWDAQPDGLTFGEGEIADLVLLRLTGDQRLKVDVTQLQFLWGEPNHPLLLMVGKNSPIKNVDDLIKGKGMTIGAATPGGNYSVIALFMIDGLGLDAKLVTGLGGSERELRVAQGTMTGSVFNEPRAARFIEQGTPIVIFGPNRLPEYPDVPTIREVVNRITNNNPSAQQLQYVDLIEKILIGGHNFFFKPGVSEDKVDFIAAAVQKSAAAHMDELKEKLVRPHIERWLTGDEVAQQSALLLGQTENLAKLLTDLFNKYRA